MKNLIFKGGKKAFKVLDYLLLFRKKFFHLAIHKFTFLHLSNKSHNKLKVSLFPLIFLPQSTKKKSSLNLLNSVLVRSNSAKSNFFSSIFQKSFLNADKKIIGILFSKTKMQSFKSSIVTSSADQKNNISIKNSLFKSRKAENFYAQSALSFSNFSSLSFAYSEMNLLYEKINNLVKTKKSETLNKSMVEIYEFLNESKDIEKESSKEIKSLILGLRQDIRSLHRQIELLQMELD